MKNVKKKLCMALSVAACLCAGVAVNAGYSPKASETVTAAAAETATYAATDVKLVDGASIRLDSELNGIRFGVFIGDEATKPYSATMKLGVLIIPEACLADGEELKYGVATSKGYNAKVVEFSGEEDRLADGTGKYENGKLFNAVLNLTDKGANYINNKYVARAYVLNTETGEVDHYVGGQISRAPAFVAAEAREVDTEDSENVLLDYLKYVEITANDVNVKKGDNYKNASTNVEGIKISYSGIVEGTVTASVGKGAVTKEFGVAELQDQRTFYNKYYTPADSFTYDLYGELNAVKFNGVALNDSDYTYENNVLSVKKSVALGDVKDADLTVETSCGNVNVNLKAYLADITSFGVDELGAEVFDHLVHAEVVSSDATAGTVTFKLNAKGEEFSAIGFHEDYLHALYANPLMADPCIKLSLASYEAGSIGYPGVKSTDGSILAQNTSLAASKTLSLNRAAYDVYAANDKLNAQFRIAVSAASVTENTTVTVERIGMQYLRDFKVDDAINPAAYNQHYYDVPLVNKNGYPLMTSTNQPITAATWAFTANAAGDDIANLPTYGISAAQRSDAVLDVTSGSDGIIERSVVTSKLMLDDNQYINTDTYEGETYQYPFAIADGEVITSITINGKVLNVAEVYSEGKITLNMSDLAHGHNALDVIVRYNNTSATYMETHFKRYYRSICCHTNSDLWSAMTFEDGELNPFMSVIGNGQLEVVDASTIEGIGGLTTSGDNAVTYAKQAQNEVYDTQKVKEAQAIDSTINPRIGASFEDNNKVLKYVPHATGKTIIYVAPFYYNARIAKIKEVNAVAWGGSNKVYLAAARMTSISVTGWTGYNVYVDDSTTGLYTGTTQYTALTSCQRQLVDEANAATLATATKYIRLELGTGANKVAVYDNIFVAGTGVSASTATGVAASWDGVNASSYVAPARANAIFTIIR